jgi:hypothetical protein
MIDHRDSVPAPLYTLLRSFMQMPALEQFALAGGTSLALRFGYRRSVDVDLFTRAPFDTGACLDALTERYRAVALLNRTAGSLSVAVDGAKVDLLLHPYPLLGEVETDGDTGIRALSVPDVAAMKVNAVTNRGAKKDFVDLLFLHQNAIPLRTSVDLFCRKYGEAGRFLALRSLAWFDDAEEEPDPLMLNGWTWPRVRRGIERAVRELIA